MSERESLEYLSHEATTGIVGDWLNTRLDLMRAGHGRRSEIDEAVQKAVDEVQYLHLSEPHLLVTKLFKALKLAGWTPPEGEIEVTYRQTVEE